MQGATEMTLVATKLTVPTVPRGLVERPRLEATLDGAVADPAVRLALVSAPAGSGKSTLIAAWQRHRDDCAWLQADRADRDPARFWGHVVGALATLVPDVEAEAGPAVAASGADADPLVERIANTLAASPPVVLVIDDYHLVGDPAVDDAVGRLIELAPSGFTVVVGTRFDPSLRLSTLRVRGQLVEVRADTLHFTPEEAGLLLGDPGADLTPAQVAALCERAEGWAAGLVLAGLSLGDSDDHDAFVANFQGDDRLVVDYLTEEFLAAADDDDRDRLLRTAVLDRLCGPLVDAVCGGDDGTLWLQRNAARNQLLIGLDRTGTWFRYHHLLGDVLRLEAERQGIDLEASHRAAARWHEDAGCPHEAVEHHLAAGELDQAAGLIYDEATELMNRGQLRTVAHQIDRLGGVAERHAGTMVVQGWIDLLTGRFAEAQRCLDQARRLEPDEDEAGLIVALAIMTHVANGDVAGALREARAADDPFESTQAMTLGGAYVWAGDLERARPFLEQADRMAPGEGHTFVQAVNPVFSAIARLASGDPQLAHLDAAHAVDVARRNGLDDLAQTALAHSVLGRTEQEPEAAIAAARRGVELAGRSPERMMNAYALASGGDVLCHHGTPDGPDLVREARAIVDRCPDPGIAGSDLARVEARHRLDTPDPADPGLIGELTERELAVLRYLPSQMSQREIADELYVSLNTVKTHCRAIYRKLAVGDRKAAVQAAREADLL